MAKPTVLISGASIAGPALAYWLNRYGYEVTVVEKAPTLRTGGQAVDFKGATHRAVLERMGIWDDIWTRRTGSADLVIVDEHDRRLATIPGEFSGGDVEIRRGDLAVLLYERTQASCTYLFGDTITSLTQSDHDVRVEFRNSATQRFDLVIGADGIHSNVRSLAFGPEHDYVRFLGHYYAVVSLSTKPGSTKPGSATAGPITTARRTTSLMYNVPGRLASIDGRDEPAFFVFGSTPLDYNRDDIATQKRLLADAYADVGWKVPDFLARLGDAAEFYFDSISRVVMEQFARGRVALLGDAAYGNTLGGFGTGLAIVGAYVLAGELATADGDHEAAFARYTERMHGYALIARKANAGPFLAPPTRWRIRIRNWTFKYSIPRRLMMKLTDSYATNIDLPDYTDAHRLSS